MKIIELIGQSMTFFIVALGVIVLIGFLKVFFDIKKLNNTIEEDKKKSRKGGTRLKGKALEEAADVTSLENKLEYVDGLNSIKVEYSVFSQFIPIFPLLGILGTVSGLIPMLNEADAVMKINDALGISMKTTFWGLVAAILLRIIDALFISNSINKLSLSFELFDQRYQMAKDKSEQDEND